MFIRNYDETPLDIRFSIGSIPCRIHPTFWLGCFLLGWRGAGANAFRAFVIYTLCVFVSILVHELGHALMAVWFRLRCQIVLLLTGGLAIHDALYWGQYGRSIAISFAGPLAGFLLYGLTKGIVVLIETQNIVVGTNLWAALQVMLFINLYWSIFNLVPVYPLDGGQIMRSLLQWIFGHQEGRYYSLIISILAGAGITAYGYNTGNQFLCIMFLLLMVQNVMEMQERRFG